MKTALVFDIGGTSFRTGVLNEEMALLVNEKFDSTNYLNSEGLTSFQIKRALVHSIYKKYIYYQDKGYVISEIGIGFPGPVNSAGEVLEAPTLWGPMDKPYPLMKEIKALIPNLPIVIINDLTAAGWRYIDENNGTFGIITVSSGVGNKLFWKKEVLLSASGYGGELGHSYYGNEYKDFLCGCGYKGHIGVIASGRGVEQIANRYIIKNHDLYKKSIFNEKKTITTYDLIQGLDRNDAFSEMVVKEGTLPIASSIHFIYSLVGIEHFIIIGGFACSVGQKYIRYLNEHLIEMGVMGKTEDEIIKMVKLGEADDLNGLYGMGNYLKYIKSKELIF